MQYGTTVAIGNVVVSPSEFLPRLFEQGGKLFNAKGQITVDTPEALAALKKLPGNVCLLRQDRA